MADRIGYLSDKNPGQVEEVLGSDGRHNSSGRVDGRIYYNSRDRSEAYSLLWDDATSAITDEVVSWTNTDSSGRILVINEVHINTINAMEFQLVQTTGVAAAGTVAAPFCLNRSKTNVAPSLAMDANGVTITGLTIVGHFNHVSIAAAGHLKIELKVT